MYRTLNPATGELLEEFPLTSPDELESILERSCAAFAWQRLAPVGERVAVLAALADRLESEAQSLGRLMAEEMGKPIAQGYGEAKKCAWACNHYAEQAAALLAPSPRASDGSEAEVRYDPLGVVLAIMPWNFPLWQAIRFAAPAIAAGNVVLLKHAPNTPRASRAIERLVAEAGGNDLLLEARLTNEQVAELIARPEIAAVTLTGSSRAGRAVGAAASGAIKRVVLELGGSDPFVVLEDADVEEAIEVGVRARLLNSGQSCVAAKRFVVRAEVYARFRDGFVERMAATKVGDPLDPAVAVGPLARADLRDLLQAQVEDAVTRGARVLTGGNPIDGPGFFHEPTVLEAIPEEARAYREEIFGPVASLYKVRTDDEALALANATPYGLGASVWTSDRTRADRFVRDLEAGSVFVNGMVKSDPRLPFGGVKQSGVGRELGPEGIREFVNVKTVWRG